MFNRLKTIVGIMIKRRRTSSRLSARGILTRGTAALVFAALLASCTVQEQFNRYPAKSDVKPHPAVARALNLPIQGIDISKWQGVIDWPAVRAAGTRFVYIKATEGGDHVDPKFMDNWNGAKAAGVARGAYHFVYWCRPAHEQVVWFTQHIPQDPDALPPVLDVEWNSHSKTCPSRLPKEQALEKIRLMLTELERHTGKRPVIYTDIPFHEEVLEGQLTDYAFWIRSTANEPSMRYRNRDWAFWQFTTTGRVPGIAGNVDRNSFYGSERDWQQFVSGRPISVSNR